jgi:hypothetical protein
MGALSFLFFGAFVSLLGFILFCLLYRRLPFEVVEIREVSISEKVAGNGVIFRVWIHYVLHNRQWHANITFSGSVRRRDELLKSAERMKDFYGNNLVRYHHLPRLPFIGILDGSVPRAQLFVGVLLAAIFFVLFVVTVVIR